MALKSNVHILFVDDDELLTETTSEMLTTRGCVITNESHGWTALQYFSEHPDDFDLAIIDPTMIGITGLELAQRFRRIQRDFPVILYGGNIDSSLLHDAEEAGVSCCQKPATNEELVQVIRQALKR